MKKLPWFLVSRNSSADTVRLWTKKPKLDCGVYHLEYNHEDYAIMCYKRFLRMTGLKLKPGECKRVRLAAPLEVE